MSDRNEMRKDRSLLRCLKITGCLVFFVFLTILLLLYHRRSVEEETNARHIASFKENEGQSAKAKQKFNLQKPKGHQVIGLDNSTRQFSYVLFSDPQVGLHDMMRGNGGTNLEHDMKKLEELGALIKTLKTRPDFIFCTGDLNNAFPFHEPQFNGPGFQPALRPQQTEELKTAFEKYFDNDIPFFTIPGNHDLSENAERKHINSFEKTWSETYFYFWNAGRVFIALETQSFRSENPKTVILRREQMKWLNDLFRFLPKDIPKTVFQHVPLFVKSRDEADSANTIPIVHRKTLLELFCANSVNIVFSGHTHYKSLPKPYKCGDGMKSVRQIVMTSITTQFSPNGKSSFILVNVDLSGGTSFKILEIPDR